MQVFWNFIVRFLLWNNWWRWWWRIWSIVGRKPSSATEPSVQMDLESKIICRRTSDSQTCHTTVSDSHRRGFYFGSRTRAQCEPSSPLICILEISYWLTRAVCCRCPSLFEHKFLSGRGTTENAERSKRQGQKMRVWSYMERRCLATFFYQKYPKKFPRFCFLIWTFITSMARNLPAVKVQT